MNRQTLEAGNNTGSIVEDASALMAATADVPGEKVSEVRRRLAKALDSAKEMAGRVRDKAVAGVKATDEAVHEHPYHAIAIGIGVGAILGYLVARQCYSKGE